MFSSEVRRINAALYAGLRATARYLHKLDWYRIARGLQRTIEWWEIMQKLKIGVTGTVPDTRVGPHGAEPLMVTRWVRLVRPDDDLMQQSTIGTPGG